MVRVLALDLATTTGWTVDGAAAQDAPLIGSFTLHHVGADVEWAYVQLERHLLDLIRVHRPECGAFEAPLPRGAKGFKVKQDSAAAARKTLGIAAVAGMVLRREGLIVKECTVDQARASLLHGGADKDAIMRTCRMYGWSPKNLDESDSVAVWVHWKRKLDPEWNRWFCGQSLKATPMFARVSA